VTVLGVGFALLLASHLTPRPQLDAERFVLRDSTRAFRGGLMIREDGSPVIRLNDADGRARLYGVVTPEGMPRLRLTDAAGHHRVVLELGADARPHAKWMDDSGRTRMHLWLDETGEPVWEMRGGAGTRVERPAAAAAR
jgi:hypothetical protein